MRFLAILIQVLLNCEFGTGFGQFQPKVMKGWIRDRFWAILPKSELGCGFNRFWTKGITKTGFGGKLRVFVRPCTLFSEGFWLLKKKNGSFKEVVCKIADSDSGVVKVNSEPVKGNSNKKLWKGGFGTGLGDSAKGWIRVWGPGITAPEKDQRF